MFTKPITPAQVEEQLGKNIPEEVIECINQRLINGDTVISQDDVIDEILLRMPNVFREEIFQNHWLDFEHLYRNAGWKVTYYKSSYGENVKATWTFSK